MKKVIVIYDDNRIPSQEIKAITGRKSFGNTILRRKSLRDRMKEDVLKSDKVCMFIDAEKAEHLTDEDYEKSSSVVVIYSDHQMCDFAQCMILLEKAVYINEIYRVVDNSTGSVAAVMYPDMLSYRMRDNDKQETSDIITDAFSDLSDAANFRQFITSGFDARFFNALSGDEYTVVKSSDNVSKIKAEYSYYKYLPESMMMWYAPAYDYKEENGRASYTMERFHMTDLAIRYVHGAIGEEEFRAIMDKLFYFIKNRVTKEVSEEAYQAEMQKLYVDKVRERVEKLKTMNDYSIIEKYIIDGTGFDSIDAIVEKYISLYGKIIAGRKFKNILVVGHGDLCFSNILYNHDANVLKLIDPKGALSEEELYMNPYYDIAKLSHSICGSYDYFNSGLFEINVNAKMELGLKIDSSNEHYMSIFNEYLEANNIDMKLIRIFEISLFLSMLPLHMDNPKKTFGFILNAVKIMEQLEDMTYAV